MAPAGTLRPPSSHPCVALDCTCQRFHPVWEGTYVTPRPTVGASSKSLLNDAPSSSTDLAQAPPAFSGLILPTFTHHQTTTQPSLPASTWPIKRWGAEHRHRLLFSATPSSFSSSLALPSPTVSTRTARPQEHCSSVPPTTSTRECAVGEVTYASPMAFA
jgi:hypothetical protein